VHLAPSLGALSLRRVEAVNGKCSIIILCFQARCCSSEGRRVHSGVRQFACQSNCWPADLGSPHCPQVLESSSRPIVCSQLIFDLMALPRRRAIRSACNKTLAQDVLNSLHRDFARHPLGAGKPPPAFI